MVGRQSFQPDERQIVVEKDGHVARVIFNRPEKLNALTGDMLEAFYASMSDLAKDDEVRVVIIKGRGRSFCAGADFDWVADNYLDVTPSTDREEIREIALRLFNAIWEFPKPTVLQVHGHCVAVGCYFLGYCDIVIADEDAVFGSPESCSFGIEPSLGLWPFTIGPRWTKAMI